MKIELDSKKEMEALFSVLACVGGSKDGPRAVCDKILDQLSEEIDIPWGYAHKVWESYLKSETSIMMADEWPEGESEWEVRIYHIGCLMHNKVFDKWQDAISWAWQKFSLYADWLLYCPTTLAGKALHLETFFNKSQVWDWELIYKPRG